MSRAVARTREFFAGGQGHSASSSPAQKAVHARPETSAGSGGPKNRQRVMEEDQEADSGQRQPAGQEPPGPPEEEQNEHIPGSSDRERALEGRLARMWLARTARAVTTQKFMP